MRRWKLFCIICITGLISSCIDPFTPELNDFQSLLVVDARLTDEDVPATVRLSNTFREAGQKAIMVEGAEVHIKDDQDNITLLTERSPGLYKTDSLMFRGERGKTYRLLITTAEGRQYESDPCPLLPVQEIDDVWFEKDNETPADGSPPIPGLRIFISSGGEKECDYMRWTCREWWKFSVPDPKMYDYIYDSIILPVSNVNQVCWGNWIPGDILIQPVPDHPGNGITKKPVIFVDPAASNRVQIRYCAEVRQMSVSAREYEFWDLMDQLEKSGGDIFDRQPFQIFSNIHNIDDPREQVLGYFQVSGVSSKRVYINYSDIISMGLPAYRYTCQRVTKGPSDYITDSPAGPPTFDEIYSMHMTSGYVFIEPVYDIAGVLQRLTFSKPECSDCTASGTLDKPAFWTD